MMDLIDRQAVLDALKRICAMCGNGEKYNGVMCGACYLEDGISIVEDAPSVQPELQWHKCDQDDPSSFPDDDRPVLVSFSDSPIPAVGWFERNCDFCGWTDGELFGLHADGWWELPKKPEREEGENE